MTFYRLPFGHHDARVDEHLPKRPFSTEEAPLRAPRRLRLWLR